MVVFSIFLFGCGGGSGGNGTDKNQEQKEKVENVSKSNIKYYINYLERNGLIVQEQNYAKYVCSNKIIKKYVLENFAKI